MNYFLLEKLGQAIEKEQDLLDCLSESPKGLPPALGLKIYQAQYKGIALKCLKDIFPITRNLLSPAVFHGLSQSYGQGQKRSFGADLNDFGEDFPDFLFSHRPIQEKLPFLLDLAKLEWLWNQLGFKEIAIYPTAQKTKKIFLQEFNQWAQLTWPSPFFILPSSFNLLEIWQQGKRKEKITPKRGEQLRYFLLYRKHHVPLLEEISPSEYWFYQDFFQNQEGPQDQQDQQDQLGELRIGLSQWLGRGLLVISLTEQ